MNSLEKPTYLEAVKHAPLKRGTGNTGSKLSAPISHLLQLKKQLSALIVKLHDLSNTPTTRLTLKAEHQALESAIQSEKNRLMRARRRADFNRSKKAINKRLSLDPKDYVFGDLKTVNYLLEYTRKHFATDHIVHTVHGSRERRKYWEQHPNSKAALSVKRHRNPYYVFDNGEDPSGGTKINPETLIVNKPVAPEILPGYSEYKSRRQRRRERGIHYVIEKIVNANATDETSEPAHLPKEVPRTHKRISHAVQQTQYQKDKDKRITIQSKRQANRLRYAKLPQNVREALRTKEGKKIPELHIEYNPKGNSRQRRNDSRRQLQLSYAEKSREHPPAKTHRSVSQMNGTHGEATNSDDVSDYAYIMLAPVALYCVKKIYHTVCKYLDMDVPSPPATPHVGAIQLNGANGEYTGSDDVTHLDNVSANQPTLGPEFSWESGHIRSCVSCLSYDLCERGRGQCSCGSMVRRQCFYTFLLCNEDSYPMRVVYIPTLFSTLYVVYGMVSKIDGRCKFKHVRGLTRCAFESGEIVDIPEQEQLHPTHFPGGVRSVEPTCYCRVCYADVTVDYYSLDPDSSSSLNGSHGEYTESDDVETAKSTVVADNKRMHKEAKNKREHSSLAEHKSSKKFQSACLYAVASKDGKCSKTGCKYNHDAHLIRDKQRELDIINGISAKQKQNGAAPAVPQKQDPKNVPKPPAEAPPVGGESCAAKLAKHARDTSSAEGPPIPPAPPSNNQPESDTPVENKTSPPREEVKIFLPVRPPPVEPQPLVGLKRLAESEVIIFGTSNESWIGSKLRYIAGFQIPACSCIFIWLAISVAQFPRLHIHNSYSGVYLVSTLVLMVLCVTFYVLGQVKYSISFVPQEFIHGDNNTVRSASQWRRCVNWHSKMEGGFAQLLYSRIIQLLECNNLISKWIFGQFDYHLEPDHDNSIVDIDALAALGYNMHRLCTYYPEVTKSVLSQYSKYGHTEKTLEQMYIWANTTFPISDYEINPELLNNSVMYAYNQYRVSKFQLSLSDPETAKKINFF